MRHEMVGTVGFNDTQNDSTIILDRSNARYSKFLILNPSICDSSRLFLGILQHRLPHRCSCTPTAS